MAVDPSGPISVPSICKHLIVEFFFNTSAKDFAPAASILLPKKKKILS